MMIDLLFERLSLEPYRNSKNIFKRMYFKYKVFRLNKQINLFIYTFKSKMEEMLDEDYLFYNLVVEYVELINNLKKIYPNLNISTKYSKIKVSCTDSFRTLAIVDRKAKYGFSIKVDINDEYFISIEFRRVDSKMTHITHFDVDKFGDFINQDTELGETAKLVSVKTRSEIVRSLSNILSSKEIGSG